MSADAAGGTTLFVGTVRSPNEGRTVAHLFDAGWPDRVGAALEKICAEALERFGATRAFVCHRTGRVEVGEASVVVAVSAPHRDAAFAACRWTIDELKQRAPIWKREAAGDGERWVANA